MCGNFIIAMGANEGLILNENDIINIMHAGSEIYRNNITTGNMHLTTELPREFSLFHKTVERTD